MLRGWKETVTVTTPGAAVLTNAKTGEVLSAGAAVVISVPVVWCNASKRELVMDPHQGRPTLTVTADAELLYQKDATNALDWNTYRNSQITVTRGGLAYQVVGVAEDPSGTLVCVSLKLREAA